MLKLPRYLEYIFVCFALWFFLGNPINLITSGGAGQLVDVYTENSNFLLPAISMAIYTTSFALLLCRWKLILARLCSSPQAVLLVIFLFFILASSQWSYRPDMTSRRSILLLGSTALSVYLSFSFDFKQQLRFLAIALGINVLICFIFGLLLPQYGIMHTGVHAGSWRGVHTHKNKLGSQMALTTVLLLTTQYSHLFKRRASLFLNATMLLSTFLVVASKSTTGLLATAAMTLTFFICNTLRLSYRYMVIGVSFIVLAIGSVSIYVQANADELLGIFGKTTGLSGRDEIWPGVWYMISRKPFLGYGYEGFWGTAGGPADLLRQIVGWPAPNAHNGFLEILLAVGWIGSFFFFVSFLITTVKSFQLVRISKQSYAIYPVLIVVFLVLGNMTESNFFNHDVWILYIWTSLSSIQISDTFLEERAKSIEAPSTSERASPVCSS